MRAKLLAVSLAGLIALTGCDTPGPIGKVTIEGINALGVLDGTSQTLSAQISSGQTRGIVYEWTDGQNQVVSTSSSYTFTAKVTDGCDADVKVNLKVSADGQASESSSVVIRVNKIWCTLRATSAPGVQGLLDDSPKKIAISPDGAVWIATPKGLNRYQDRKWTAFTSQNTDRANGLQDDNIWALATAPNGDIWVSPFFDGVNRYEPATNKWTLYTENDDPSFWAREIAIDASNRVNILWENGGYVLNLATGRLGPRRALFAGAYSYAAVQNVLWYGTGEGTIEQFSQLGGSLGAIRLNQVEGGPQAVGLALESIQVNDSQVWVALRPNSIDARERDIGGVMRLVFKEATSTNGDWKLFTKNNGLASNDVSALVLSGGNVWAATTGGLSRFVPGVTPDKDTWQSNPYKANPSDPNRLQVNAINDIAFRESDQTLWIATKGGGVTRLWVPGLP